jgi:signal transduction histidine kinase
LNQRTAARLAWSVALTGVGMAIASAVLIVLDRHVDPLGDADIIDAIVPLGFSVVGAFIASRRRENPIGWLFLAIAAIAAASGLGRGLGIRLMASGHPGAAAWGVWIENWISNLIFPDGLLLFLLLLFPNGTLPGPRWRWLLVAGLIFTPVFSVLSAIDPSRITVAPRFAKVANPVGVPALGHTMSGPIGGFLYLAGLVLLLVGAFALFRRTRRSSGEESQQLRAFAYTTGGTVASLFALSMVYLGLHQSADLPFNILIGLGFGVATPVACGVAILRHGLYEIDVVVNRTVVFGVLIGFLTAVYVGIVVGIGAAVGSRGNDGLSILATAIIVVAFQPIRDRARRFANRLVYGKRATPYEVLSEFADRMAATYSLEDVLPRTARILAEATGAVRADVWLQEGRALRVGASWPGGDGVAPTATLAIDGNVEVRGATRSVPVRHQGELLGALSIEKAAGDPLTPAEDKLLSDVASQAGLVLRNVRLIEDLRASRLRLVAAQDQERRRLERNIHDGAQQQLVAVAVKQRLAEQLVARDPDKAAAMLQQLQADTTQALEDLRDLARGIYPPLLADQGLVAALEAQAHKTLIPVQVEAEGIARYSQDVEAAVYFCTLEALQNVAKYAQASRAVVRLAASNGSLTFSVADDGRGFDPRTTPRGTGLQGMADRLAALGGEMEVRSAPGQGVTVIGRISSS